MKRFFLLIPIVLSIMTLASVEAKAVVDPLMSQNNKIGIHVLDPSEVREASRLVNGEYGSWGYVTVPIQASDRDRAKWIDFMREAKENKVIPIIRVATVVSGLHWDEPNNYDLVDFANFLNDLDWPTKNRYVIIFNEVNRADEYGGYVSPEKYADVLSNAITIFKERSEDFYILPAGMDNAAATTGPSLHWREYWKRAIARQPDVINRIDGWTSHAYPNPAFKGLPTDRTDRSVASFLHELNFLSTYTSRAFRVFITETGWDMSITPPSVVATYMQSSFSGVWSDPRVVTITPFLLRAGGGPFVKFSFLNADGSPNEVYKVWKFLASEGNPQLGGSASAVIKSGGTGEEARPSSEAIMERLKPVDWSEVWRWLRRVFGLSAARINAEREVLVGERKYQVELADTPRERSEGLSGRTRLHSDEGMLFLFDKKARYSFWMKGMSFDIDIVWINDGVVVDIDTASYKTPSIRYRPEMEVDMVLEVVSGSGIKVDDRVEVR